MERKMESTLASLGVSKAKLMKIIICYLNDYAKEFPEEIGSISKESYPSFGELDTYLNKYPSVMDALMDGGDGEFESIIQDAIELWMELGEPL